MNGKTRSFFFVLAGFAAGMLLMYGITFFKNESFRHSRTPSVEYGSASGSSESYGNFQQSIEELTRDQTVTQYIQQNHRLPDYYITKKEARAKGWNPSQGNLCEVLPGRAIGGDRFGNREGSLPQGPDYYEADVNYRCGGRNADRIVFTRDGDVYLTKDHYKSFKKQ
ncbi:ribonuclease domain-containing protein [uncultured Chryseobacterium sp.]|uniref:ribonuclease domain-containing protein n=1 Tax=uncultured Chryseobacterium sp. TaxID=259322 RepID=UPI0025ECD8AC|nr:ribonuclease domain-containing protein [uncultured Chryseobacterium sp.]